MPMDAYSAATNETYEDIRPTQETASSGESDHEGLVLSPAEYQILDTIQQRVLWLYILMIHHANHVRPNPDDLKVGGHQFKLAKGLGTR